jgi:hypothetical protein
MSNTDDKKSPPAGGQTAEGFCDPGGIVSENIRNESRGKKFDLLNSPMGEFCHVAGRWPGGKPQ